MTPSELTYRARTILGTTPPDAPTWYTNQVSVATVAVLSAGAGRWSEAVAQIRDMGDAFEAQDPARARKWRELANDLALALRR